MNVTQFAVMRAVERHENEPLSRVADDLAACDCFVAYIRVASLSSRTAVAAQENSPAGEGRPPLLRELLCGGNAPFRTFASHEPVPG
jgi:hypothetical protein